jgi:hypothetical protein
MDSTRISVDSTLAPQEPGRAQRFRQGAFIALMALIISTGVFGLARIPSNTSDSVGTGRPIASTGGIDRALVEALASNYPPPAQAEAYRAAADEWATGE